MNILKITLIYKSFKADYVFYIATQIGKINNKIIDTNKLSLFTNFI